MIVVRTAAPAVDLIPLADMKGHLRILHSDEDAEVTAYTKAACQAVEDRVGKALIEQTWQASAGPLAGTAAFRFPVVPFIDLVSISYFDRDNASQILATSDVTVFAEEDRAWMVPLIGEAWPAMYQRPDAVTVTWKAGYGAAGTDVPANIVQAARLLAGHFYQYRDEAAEVPPSVEALIGLSRVGWVGA